MRKNNQPHEQFLREFGALLTTHTRHSHAVQQQQALVHLAEHIRSARRHHCLSRALLAQKTGKAEAEIYALELGVLPYAELDLRFLQKLAVALDEDLETLLLLLGRPALAQALQRQQAGYGVRTSTSLYRHNASRPGASSFGEGTTEPQLGDNVSPFTWLTNLLYKGYLNLIDSMQEGRLLAYVRNSQRTWVPISLFVCLLCIWVATYSFTGHFGAKSTQPFAIATGPSTVSHDLGLQSKPSGDFVTPVTLALSTHNRPSIARTTARAIEEDLGTPMAISVPAFSADVQLCDFRTMGKFALCRV